MTPAASCPDCGHPRHPATDPRCDWDLGDGLGGCECTATLAASQGDPLHVERLRRAIADHHDTCSRMAIPECAELIAHEYAALAAEEERG